MKLKSLTAAKLHPRQRSDWFLPGLVIITSSVLFAFSNLQLWLFREGNDLAFFDQLVYLLSRGDAPISTTLEGVHLIGDHGALVFYPLSLFYVIYPDVRWLLAIQAISYAWGAVPIYGLSRDSGLSVKYARAIAICYALYPGIFNINFYAEFRPESIAVPALIWAVWAAQKRAWQQYIPSIILVLSCKETLALTVIGLGCWLCLWQKRFWYGLTAVVAGVIWFGFAALYLIPTFRGGHQMAGTWHYGSLGTSLSEIAFKILANPQILLGRAVMGDRLFYYLLLIAPILIGLHWRKIAAIVPALPMLALNILADYPRQRDLIHQYALPIIPFLFIWLIASQVYLSKRRLRRWLTPRWLIVWSIVGWLALAKYGYFWTRYAPLYDNVAAVNRAVELVDDEAKVLTSGYIAPHLSQRPTIALLKDNNNVERIAQLDIDTVLIAKRHLGFDLSLESANQTMESLATSSQFVLIYQEQDVFLWQKKSAFLNENL
ncbi:MAG: DUF2079 domain-containing protein [Cyanobacteria bacterium J06623_7]